MTDGSQIQTLLRDTDTENNLAAARGDAGFVNIDVHSAVDIAGVMDGLPSGILTLVSTEAQGNGGNINIKSGTFSLTDDAQLTASTLGIGNAGSVFIQASDSVSLEDSGIYSDVEEERVGNGGSININTGSLTVNNGAELNATVWGQGSGGNIIINARDRVAFDGKEQEIFSRAINTLQQGGIGKAGDIQVTTGTI